MAGRGAALAALLLGIGNVARSPAPTIRGELIGATSGQPVPFGLIVLLDAATVERGRTTTAGDGSFSLQAPAAGDYQLRALRIGYRRWDSPALHLAQGQILSYRIEMPELPVELAGLTVEARRDCRVRPAAGEAAGTLWEEVAKALSITQLTIARRVYRFRTETFRRTLDPARHRLEEHRASNVGFGDWSFVSLPPESLAQRGFVYDSTGGPVYVAPDIPVLLSDAFLGSHCFRVQSPGPDATGSIGLAFEPARGRSRPDIAGVLWVDRATAELRFLEYRYTNLAAWVPADQTGGRVEFHRLPTGAWFIRRWEITAPIPRIGAGAQPVQLHGFRQGGGEVREVLMADGGSVIVFPRAP